MTFEKPIASQIDRKYGISKLGRLLAPLSLCIVYNKIYIFSRNFDTILFLRRLFLFVIDIFYKSSNGYLKLACVRSDVRIIQLE